jgi:hypothetical protein
MIIPGLDKGVQQRLDACSQAMRQIAVHYFPELVTLYGTELDDRIFMTMYLELIHMGFFKDGK